MHKPSIEWLKSKIDSYSDGENLNIHAIIKDSYVNGPGRRMVVWFRGCPFACEGCFNKETWGFTKVKIMTVLELYEEIASYDGDGITFSGGEPTMQAKSFLSLLKKIETINFSKGIMCFTGCEKEEIEQIPLIQECMEYIDLTITGRYVDDLRQYDHIAGSSNQSFVFLNKEGRGEDKISIEEVEIDQEIEVHEGENNTFQITGFPDINNEILSKLGIKVIG